MIEKKREPIELTENQRKVIQDKYLKDAPSVEAWLDGVCSNIALADVLHSKNVSPTQIFDGVSYGAVEKEVFDGQKSAMALLHKGLDKSSERRANFKKFLNNLENLTDTNPAVAQEYEATREKFYHMLSSLHFLPNSPTLMNAGRVLQQLSACYVLPIEDSIQGWMKTAMDTAIIHQSGGGTGFSASRVRSKGAAVSTTMGVASGPLSPLKIIDQTTAQIKQGGTRRGANMGILSVYHPNIKDFITCKHEEGFLDNFNISVAIDEPFMDKVKNGGDIELVDPKTKEVTDTLNAKELFDEMVESAWATGDPGFVVIDRINNSDSNPTPHVGQIESTNPCGEQPLLAYEPCNLGSINLSKFVNTTQTDMDWDALRDCVHTTIHFLDNVIDVNNYPLPEIEEMAKSNRRIGLGVMGWGESLAMMKIPYNDEKAVAKAEQVMKFINDEAMNKSESLAVERGVFPNWKNSIFDKDGQFFRGEYAKPRHCARTTIAPTGTIGITAGLQGAGIEPFFAIVYTRYNAAAIDALKKGEKPLDKDTFFEVNPIFRKVAEENNFFGMQEEELWKKVEDNHKSLVGIAEIPVEIQNAFLTSHDLNPEDHCRMQVAFQKYTNNAVSKTVNLRNEATAQDVYDIYMMGFELGVKGITIYRDGSKSQQVLNLSKKDKKEEVKEEVSEAQLPPKSRKKSVESSDYYEIMTGHGPLHVHINYDEYGPTRVFVNLSPSGTEISGLACSLGIMISKYLNNGGDPIKLLKHLNSIKGDKPFGLGTKRIDSIPHGISKALREHLIKTGKIQSFGQTSLADISQATLTETRPVEEKEPKSSGSFISVEPEPKMTENVQAAGPNAYLASSLYCPKCFSANVEIVSGCSKPTCFDCGFSECG